MTPEQFINLAKTVVPDSIKESGQVLQFKVDKNLAQELAGELNVSLPGLDPNSADADVSFTDDIQFLVVQIRDGQIKRVIIKGHK